MNTLKLDDNWQKVVSGEWTIEQWAAQAEDGPEITITEEELNDVIEIDLSDE